MSHPFILFIIIFKILVTRLERTLSYLFFSLYFERPSPHHDNYALSGTGGLGGWCFRIHVDKVNSLVALWRLRLLLPPALRRSVWLPTRTP